MLCYSTGKYNHGVTLVKISDGCPNESVASSGNALSLLSGASRDSETIFVARGIGSVCTLIILNIAASLGVLEL